MTATPRAYPKGVLFDLDGTLLDSAPDMLATVNRMLASRDRPSLALPDIRPVVSRGARAMASVAFPELDTDGVTALVPEFLAVYAEELGRHSVLFDGVEAMLAALEAAGTPWGIVTNKPEYLARDILPQLGWQTRCGVLVGGDTLAEPKFIEGDQLKQFDVIFANPPYSIKKWNRDKFAADPYGRNLYGVPPQGCADYGFYTHIIKSLKPDTGRAAMLWPHGVLFRGSSEGRIREQLINENLLDAVIGLHQWNPQCDARPEEAERKECHYQVQFATEHNSSYNAWLREYFATLSSWVLNEG